MTLAPLTLALTLLTVSSGPICNRSPSSWACWGNAANSLPTASAPAHTPIWKHEGEWETSAAGQRLFMCVCVFLPAQGEILEMELWKHAVAHLCVCMCVSMCGTWAWCAPPQGRKAENWENKNNDNNNNDTVGSAEPHTNMDVTEIHQTIMTAFMHFSLAVWMDGRGIKETKWERFRKK